MPHKTVTFNVQILLFLSLLNFNTMAQENKIRKIELATNFTIKWDETVLIDNNLFFTFDGNSHKIGDNIPQPLIHVKFRLKEKLEEETKSFFVNETIWLWGNYVFNVIKCDQGPPYSKIMELKVSQSDVIKTITAVQNSNDSITVSLKVGENKTVFQGLFIKYIDYGHEHSSSGPNEPFAATTAFYRFELSENDITEKIILYTGLTGPSETLNWKNYHITLLSNSDKQTEVTIGIKHLNNN